MSPFLTDLDSRAEVRGSVDPLGAMSIWTRMGRRVVGNLTTVSSSVRDFKTLVLGFSLIDSVHRRNGPEVDTDELATFLRWEQLAAYTRGYVNNDFEFRGTRRVKRTLSDSTTVPISAQSDCQILGNQKTYGLWGLFTVPARASQLLDKEKNVLTVEAEEFVSRTWRKELGPAWPGLVDLVRRDTRRFSLERPSVDLQRLRTVWRKMLPGEPDFWNAHIVDGGPRDETAGRQAALARVLKRFGPASSDLPLSPSVVKSLSARAARENPLLGEYLLDIAACESVLAPATALYSYLQSCDGRPMSAVLDGLRKAWPGRLKGVELERFLTLVPELAKANESPAVASHWGSVAEDLARGSYDSALPRLIEINALVMRGRKGAPWVLDENGTVRVKYRDGAADLPQRDELEQLWRFPYFLPSLHRVVRELEAA